MLRQSLDGGTQAGALRGALARAYEVLREPHLDRQLALIASDLSQMLDASAVRMRWPDDNEWIDGDQDEKLPKSALAMEAALLPRALAAERSLLSTHPLLDPDLEELAASCRADESVVHLLLARAHRQTHAVFSVHWVGRERPEFDRRFALYYYWDLIGLAVAASRERSRLDVEVAELRHAAYTDRLTGLPNAVALEQQLRDLAEIQPLSIAVLDFDGLREANTALGWVDGGDALIRSVGCALIAIAQANEYPARLHTAGDEFAVLLPGLDEQAAAMRATDIEKALDALPLPTHLRAVYHGASVGHATRRPRETPGQALGRAVAAMRDRKRDRAHTRR